MKKISTKNLIIGSLVALTTTLALTACSSNLGNKVIFSIAQPTRFPIAAALTKLVPYYNQTFSKEKDFVEIGLITTENHYLMSETKLLNDTVSKITANDPLTPSLILNTPSSASAIQSQARLLDVSDLIKPSNFTKYIAPVFNKISGAKDDVSRFYALPLTSSSLETLAVNLIVLRFLIDVAIDHGATIKFETNKSGILQDTFKINPQISPQNLFDKIRSELQTSSENAQKRLVAVNSNFAQRYSHPNNISYNINIDSQNSSITLFKPLIPTKNDLLKDYTITNDTFNYYQNLVEFSQKITSVIQKKPDYQAQETDKNVNILSVDYFTDILDRFIWQNSGESQDRFIWKYQKDANGKNEVVYPFENPNSNEEKNLIESVKQFVGNDHLFKYDQTKKIKDVFYTRKDSYLSLRTFNTAFAIAPSVALLESVQSESLKTSTLGDIQDATIKNQKFALYPKLDTEVKWYHQVMDLKKANNPDTQKSTYVLGGSSLIPIKTNPTKDKGLIKFLDWLYNGKINDQKTTDFIEEQSMYFVPTANNYDTIEKSQVHYQQIINKIQKSSGDKQLRLKSLALSIQDFIRFQKIEDQYSQKNQQDQQNRSALFNKAGDIITANYSSNITKYLGTKNGKNEPITGQGLIAYITKSK
ncbi:hypothetical protein MCAV_02110 [[Mycoplasma] cavipharyngis]|uniref:P80 family lipoprotein n=1 Tax=[Mycoplasma] cavipharyngis TaxID=92757 RepID=UPI003704C922